MKQKTEIKKILQDIHNDKETMKQARKLCNNTHVNKQKALKPTNLEINSRLQEDKINKYEEGSLQEEMRKDIENIKKRNNVHANENNKSVTNELPDDWSMFSKNNKTEIKKLDAPCIVCGLKEEAANGMCEGCLQDAINHFNTQEIEQKAGRGGAGTPVHSTTDEIVRGKTAIPNGVSYKPKTPPSDNTQKTRHSSKTRNYEQKDKSNLETLDKKQNYPSDNSFMSFMKQQKEIPPRGIHVPVLGSPSVIEDKLNYWFNKWMQKPVSGRCFIEVKEIVKESYNQGIQKAIDDCLILVDNCRKGLLTNQQADILHVKICKLNQEIEKCQ